MDLKTSAKKLWNFIWYDDSWESWVLNVILAFVIVKYFFYPSLGFLLGTGYPIVAVVSGSMEHHGAFSTWWETECRRDVLSGEIIKQKDLYSKFSINQDEFPNFRFKNGFNRGDIMILSSPKQFKIGDVLVFNADHAYDPVIHRVVSVNEKFFKTKGDANCMIANFEENVPRERALGKAVLRIPLLGWVKILFVEITRFFVRW